MKTKTDYQLRSMQTKARRAEVYARRRREEKAWALYWRDYSKWRGYSMNSMELGERPNQGDYFTPNEYGHLDASEWAQARFGELSKKAA
jgi:hypothetical protein